jgi:hypothetical protein
MSQKDRTKLVVALVVLVGAGLLIWWNVREPGPAPTQGSFTSSASASGGQAQPAPASGGAPMPNGGRGQVKK